MEPSVSPESAGSVSWAEVKALAETGNWEECRKKLLQVIPAKPSDSIEFGAIGREALKIVALSVSDDVSSVNDFITLAASRAEEIYEALGRRFPSADATITKIQLAVAEGSPYAYATIAKELRELGRPARAVDAASIALKHQPTNVAALVTRAASYADLLQLDLAEVDIKRAEAHHNNDPYVMNIKSRVRDLQGQTENALRIALKAFHDRPSSIGARQVGSRLEKLGNKKAMISWYELADKMPAEIKPSLTEAQTRGVRRLAEEAMTELEALSNPPKDI